MDETGAVGEQLQGLVADSDLGILLVEHDMAFVMGICTELFVLDFGQIIASGSAAEMQQNPMVRAAYLGAEVA